MSFGLFPPVICKDGLFMSVQASSFHYSTPKEDLDTYEYEDVELRLDNEDLNDTEKGFLSCFAGHSENEYHYVPISVIDAMIEKHGGLDETAIEKAINEQE